MMHRNAVAKIPIQSPMLFSSEVLGDGELLNAFVNKAVVMLGTSVPFSRNAVLHCSVSLPSSVTV